METLKNIFSTIFWAILGLILFCVIFIILFFQDRGELRDPDEMNKFERL